MNFSKWALTPKGERDTAKKNPQNIEDFDLLLDFGYNNDECHRIRDFLGNRKPQAQQLKLL